MSACKDIFVITSYVIILHAKLIPPADSASGKYCFLSALSGKYKRGKSSSRLIWSLIALLKYQTIDKWLHLRKGKYHLDSNLLDRVITLYKITKEQSLILFKNLLQRDKSFDGNSSIMMYNMVH